MHLPGFNQVFGTVVKELLSIWKVSSVLGVYSLHYLHDLVLLPGSVNDCLDDDGSRCSGEVGFKNRCRLSTDNIDFFLKMMLKSSC